MNQDSNQQQSNRVEELKNQLPRNWASQCLQICEDDLKMRYTRQHIYKILRTGNDSHDVWKVIEGIARRYQETLSKVS